MKFIDKENVIVIGIALALLIAWGVWYPRHQTKVAAQLVYEQYADRHDAGCHCKKSHIAHFIPFFSDSILRCGIC